MEKELNEEIIRNLQNSDTYRETFNNLTEEEKEEYFIYLYSSLEIYSYLKEKEDEFIINYINSHDLTGVKVYTLQEMLGALKDKSLIFKIVDSLPNDVFSHFRFRYMFREIEGDFNKIAILNKLVSKNLESTYLEDLVKLLESDKNKTKYFSFFTLGTQVSLIETFKDLELKKEMVMKPEYTNYRSQLVASVEDNDFIIETFEKITAKKFRFNLIRRVENLILKEELIRRLGDKTLTEFIDSFKEEESELKLDDDIDPNITIGVELETCHKNIEVLKILKEMPHGFTIKKDGSVNSGFEIVSPILRHTNYDMSNLKDICRILEENSFYTDQSCGGHIHLGADYLETIDEYKMFLHLYCNFEDIIYLICNREHTKGRKTLNRYASKMKKEYMQASKEGFFEGDYESLEDFREKLVELNDSRYKGLNVYNLKKYELNTFEFRMANGEIDFNELYHNIRLYARLLQVSKELANMNDNDPRKEYLIALSNPLKEIEKLEILLALLFKTQEDREFYKERYKKNISVIESIMNEIRKGEEAVLIVNPMTLKLV